MWPLGRGIRVGLLDEILKLDFSQMINMKYGTTIQLHQNCRKRIAWSPTGAKIEIRQATGLLGR